MKQPISNSVNETKIKYLPGKKQQNFGMREREFDEMVLQLQAGNEQLFEHVFLAHFGSCVKYLMHKYKTDYDKAYDTTMDTMLVFRKRILAGKVSYGNLRFLFTQMASQLLSKTFKSVTYELSEEHNNRIEIPNEREAILDILDQAWNVLCAECSHLLKAFYYDKTPLKVLAKRKGKSDAALRKEKQRCLEKLRVHFLKKYQEEK